MSTATPASASRRGTTTIADAVVLKVAAGAVHGVAGVHAVGGAGARAAGAVRGRLAGSPGASTQGLAVVVGQDSAAVAVELVALHGTSLPAVAEQVRRSVADAVQSLVGLRVTAVDVLVVDVHVPTDDVPGSATPGATPGAPAGATPEQAGTEHLPRTRTTAR